MTRFFLAVFITFFVSCKTKSDLTKEGYSKAEILKYEVESCGFLIQLQDGKLIMPSKALPSDFLQDKLKVWVKYQVLKKQSPNNCMAGETADIVDIKKVK